MSLQHRRSGATALLSPGYLLFFFALLVPGLVLAQAHAGGEAKPSVELLFAQIIILIFCGRLLGELMQRIGQPAVIGQLLAGLLLGPSVLGVAWPGGEAMLFPKLPAQKAMLDGIAQIGILLLLLLTGMETDLRLVRKVGKPAIAISIAGILVPFAFGVAAGQFIPDSLLPHPEARLITSLFLGTALSISSVKIVAMVVREMNFMRRNVGQIIISAAITDDTIGWIIIAITFSLAQSGTIEPWALAKSIIGTALFLIASLTIGRRIVFSLIRWANDHFVSEVPVISTIFVIMGVMSLITYEIGVHTVLGAFVAGVLVGESPILTRHIDEQLRGMITGFFAPVFFGLSGLSADLTVLKDGNLFLLTLALIAIASVGKFAGAFVGGTLGGLKANESLALASGMNARGSTEVIVATIGLSLGMLSENLFTMIVTMAVVTTMAMPPMLRFALSRLPLGEEEKKRLEREEFEAKGFVPNMERLLLAVDESANGQFASRLAGLVAGSRGMPTTVFQLDKSRSAATKAEKARSSAAAVESAAEKSKGSSAKTKDKDENAPDRVDVTARVQQTPTRQAIEDEAKRGYDLLFVGIDQAVSEKGVLRNEVSRIAAGFLGPLAVVAARGRHASNPTTSPLNILVAVAGTDLSRRAAEMAIVIARGGRARIGALYVTDKSTSSSKRSGRRESTSHQEEEAILKDIVEIADRYSKTLTTAVRANVAPHIAILQEASLRRYDLIVMGVARRPGDKLSFGDTAQAVLEKAKCSVLFLTDGTIPKPPKPKG